MTRSIHETRRHLENAQRWHETDPGRHQDRLAVLEHRLALKRRYKRRTSKSSEMLVHGGVPIALELVTEDGQAQAHQPLSEADVRRLLELFPADVRPTVERVNRRIGWREQAYVDDEDAHVDPMIGRHGYERPGGIWSPLRYGQFRYDRRTAPTQIDLFAYVYEESTLRVPVVQTTILWLEQATTLAHEVAHAWDYSARVARDRWAMDETKREESYATEMARQWACTVACAYFVDAYPATAKAFGDWVFRHIGIPISLARVAEDLDRAIWGVDKALLRICANWGDMDQLDARVEVANEFHYVDDWEPAKQILQTVLDVAPTHVGATTLMGHIAVHESKWIDALAWTAEAVELAPADPHALAVRADALEGSKRWAEMLVACEKALENATDTADDAHAAIRLKRARARMELGSFEGAASDLRHVIARDPDRADSARARLAELLVREARWQEAREEALAGLARKPWSWPEALFTATLWEASQNLGVDSKPVPTTRQIRLLRWNGREEWANRLLAMGLKPMNRRQTRRQVELDSEDLEDLRL